VRGEFGYWVFEGDRVPAQRPSWNYRKQDGGGIILDMLCHWRYVLDNLFGEVKSVSCLGATHIPWRWDENGKKYKATADDAAYATFSSPAAWSRTSIPRGTCACGATTCSRCRSMAPGKRRCRLRRCLFQVVRKNAEAGVESGHSAADRFLRRLGRSARRRATTTPSRCSGSFSSGTSPARASSAGDCSKGAKGVQLAELGLKSWKQKKWLDVPRLKA
jgi:predicted dehydrogenase